MPASSTGWWLVKFLLDGTVDSSFGTSGWLRYSTLPGARAAYASTPTYFVSCAGKIYTVNRSSSNEWSFDKLDLGATPAFTQLGSTTASGAALSALRCVEGKAYMALDQNPSNVRAAFVDTTTDTYTLGPLETDTGTYLGFTRTAAGDLWTYDASSPSALFRRLDLATAGATAVLESKTVLTSGGRPYFFDGVYHESTSRAVMYTRAGTTAHLDVLANAPTTVIDVLTNAASTYAPTVSYAPQLVASTGATGLSQDTVCAAGSRYLAWAYVSPSSAYTFGAMLFNADGTRFGGFNGGNEVIFSHAPYNYYTGRYYLTIACDSASGMGAFAYKNAAGQPTVYLANMAAP